MVNRFDVQEAKVSPIYNLRRIIVGSTRKSLGSRNHTLLRGGSVFVEVSDVFTIFIVVIVSVIKML